VLSGIPERWDVGPIIFLVELYNHDEGKLGIESEIGLSGCLIFISNFLAGLVKQ
jgi:hypothetical protein